MYEIRPESIKTFIDDNNIKLPRFQRKQTWDSVKNFKLCISIFKEYPIGVSILSIENNNHKTTRWLLDGRQRRTALIEMADDPENIYLWAKKFIGFENKNQPQVIIDKFWEKIYLYLEQDNISDSESDSESDNYLNDNDNDEDCDIQDEILNNFSDSNGLDLLLNIILMIHNMKYVMIPNSKPDIKTKIKINKHSGFSRPFDLSKYIKKLPYVENSNGFEILKSKKIKTFINEYKNYCRQDRIDYENIDNYKEFIKIRFRPNDITEKEINLEINKNWSKIIERIDILDKIDNLLLNSKIGLIEVKNINAADGQKIFNIINSEGTQLSAVEILSAKPNWNILMKNPSPHLVEETKKLYEKIGQNSTLISANNVVKWDIPATLISRLNLSEFIFKKFPDNNSGFERKLTLGFKLLSGILRNGIKKEDINSLSINNINWEIDVETIINNINTIIKLLSEHEYFRYFRSWNGSIMDLLSDTIALNFLTLTYKNWVKSDITISSSSKVKIFQKNSVILLDKLIYEYISREWKGSSDNKFAKYNKYSEDIIYKPIDKTKWLNILTEIFDENTINDVPIDQKNMIPILFHFYCLKKISGPNNNINSIHVDHIIPKASFKKSLLKNGDTIQNNLFNLSLLPASENISKSDDKLNEITDQWLKDQILKYAFISETDFDKYSNLNNLNELKQHRRVFFENTFDVDRDNLFNN